MVDQKKSEPDQKFPETEQIFFGRPKKERNRLDNWSTKRLTKTTWTGLIFIVQTEEELNLFSFIPSKKYTTILILIQI